MFYAKVPLAHGASLEAEVRHDNVYARCHCCGEEIQVDLADVLGDGSSNLESTQLLCPECSRLLLKRVHVP